MKLKITSTQIVERPITAKTGKSYVFREQNAVMDFPNGERRVIIVSLEPGQAAYPAGEYTIGDASFYVDRNSKLAVGRLALHPVAASVAGVKTA